MAIDLRHKQILFVSCGVGAFSLLLLIISVGIPTWTIDDDSNSVGLFRECYGPNAPSNRVEEGCTSKNRVTQGGLSVFGLLLLSFGVIAGIAGTFMGHAIITYVALGLLYFASLFVMSAYATWGVYSRDPEIYTFGSFASGRYQKMGAGYNLCVAAHYFLWTALTAFAFGVGAAFGNGLQESG